MRHLAAFLLLVAGGNATPTAEDVSNVLSQAGMESDPERLTALLAELDGKDINQVVALGKSKLMVGGGMSSGGGGAAPAAAAGAPGTNFFNPDVSFFQMG
jgi:large subunit ribosomal protein LP2